jgi:acyl carrier protein
MGTITQGAVAIATDPGFGVQLLRSTDRDGPAMNENPYQAPNCSEPARGWSRIVIVFVLLTIGVAYFSVVVPPVLSGRLDRAWAIAPAFLGVVFVLVYFFDPNMRAQRRYERQLKEREPVDDEGLLEEYFLPEELDRDIPARVRGILAKHMGYPAERMLPDDDLMFYWDEVDAAELVLEIEERFGIKITEADTEHKMFTIREISHLVHKKRDATSTTSG